MSENRTILCETADGLFADLADADFASGWARIEEAGFATLLIPEERGGFGGDHGDLFAVLRLAGEHALNLPLGETILAAALIGQLGLALPPGAMAITDTTDGTLNGHRFTGRARHVPWGRDIRHVVAALGDSFLVIPTAGATVEPSHNPAHEPRDTLVFRDVPVQVRSYAAPIRQWSALARVAQIAGALDRALALSIDHANQRQQFGRPLAKFQAVQQNLAVLAAEAAAVNCAGAAAAAALDRGTTDDHALIEIAAAKIRANTAVGVGCAIAHQVHGAIGFTHEYPLHRVTRRMMGWRSESGNDRFWSERLGKHAARLGASGLWREITARADAL